jgi:hypothetical protein
MAVRGQSSWNFLVQPFFLKCKVIKVSFITILWNIDECSEISMDGVEDQSMNAVECRGMPMNAMEYR